MQQMTRGAYRPLTVLLALLVPTALIFGIGSAFAEEDLAICEMRAMGADLNWRAGLIVPNQASQVRAASIVAAVDLVRPYLLAEAKSIVGSDDKLANDLVNWSVYIALARGELHAFNVEGFTASPFSLLDFFRPKMQECWQRRENNPAKVFTPPQPMLWNSPLRQNLQEQVQPIAHAFFHNLIHEVPSPWLDAGNPQTQTWDELSLRERSILQLSWLKVPAKTIQSILGVNEREMVDLFDWRRRWEQERGQEARLLQRYFWRFMLLKLQSPFRSALFREPSEPEQKALYRTYFLMTSRTANLSVVHYFALAGLSEIAVASALGIPVERVYFQLFSYADGFAQLATEQRDRIRLELETSRHAEEEAARRSEIMARQAETAAANAIAAAEMHRQALIREQSAAQADALAATQRADWEESQAIGRAQARSGRLEERLQRDDERARVAAERAAARSRTATSATLPMPQDPASAQQNTAPTARRRTQEVRVDRSPRPSVRVANPSRTAASSPRPSRSTSARPERNREAPVHWSRRNLDPNQPTRRQRRAERTVMAVDARAGRAQAEAEMASILARVGNLASAELSSQTVELFFKMQRRHQRGEDPLAIPVARPELQALIEYIQLLPPRDQRSVLLYLVERSSQREMEAALGVSYSLIHLRLKDIFSQLNLTILVPQILAYDEAGDKLIPVLSIISIYKSLRTQYRAEQAGRRFTGDEQLECAGAGNAHLAPNNRWVVDCSIPGATQFVNGFNAIAPEKRRALLVFEIARASDTELLVQLESNRSRADRLLFKARQEIGIPNLTPTIRRQYLDND